MKQFVKNIIGYTLLTGLTFPGISLAKEVTIPVKMMVDTYLEVYADSGDLEAPLTISWNQDQSQYQPAIRPIYLMSNDINMTVIMRARNLTMRGKQPANKINLEVAFGNTAYFGENAPFIASPASLEWNMHGPGKSGTFNLTVRPKSGQDNPAKDEYETQMQLEFTPQP